MIKFVMCVTRRADLSREEFTDYWQNKHGAYFVENAAAVIGAKKYVQSQTIETPLNQGLKDSRGMRTEYDGIAEVWFESEQAMMDGMGSPEGQKIAAYLHEDESNFIDHNKSTAFIVHEETLI